MKSSDDAKASPHLRRAFFFGANLPTSTLITININTISKFKHDKKNAQESCRVSLFFFLKSLNVIYS